MSAQGTAGVEPMKGECAEARPLPESDRLLDSIPAFIPSRQDVLDGPNIECLEPAEVWVRPAADFVVDLSGASLENYLSEPQVHERHASYRNRFSDVRVFGWHHFHGVLSADGRIDCQVVDSVQQWVDIHIDNHPGRDAPIPQIYRDPDGYRISCASVIPEELNGSLHFGTPTEPLNWGLWLLQGIPSAMNFLSGHTAERFFVYVGTDWQRKLLNTLGIPDESIVHQELCRTYRCENVVLDQYSSIDLVPSLQEKEIFNRVAHDIAGVRPSKPKRRIFLSRRSITKESNGVYRALENEEELLEAVSARGYEIVEPELLPFVDQIRIFAEAELVVGLGGAGLFNTIFCPPETRVVSIESSNVFVHSHALLFAAFGHPFGIIFGRQDPLDDTPVQKRWSVDVANVMRTLNGY
jgi:hypothetical protein